ncbi:MAG: hypothetical protein GY928_12265 [Colwellia sp.]|nr:hypothetical protein [Colwellia sp.]
MLTFHREAISAARSLRRERYPILAVSRAYYSAFYTVTAILLSEPFEFKRAINSLLVFSSTSASSQNKKLLQDYFETKSEWIKKTQLSF